MRRGEIWTVAGGVYASKPRPAIVIQDDSFDAMESVTVCPFTTTELDAPLIRYRVEADALTGVDKTSFVMVDKLTTIRRANAMTQLGRLSSTQLGELERLILVFLGLAR